MELMNDRWKAMKRISTGRGDHRRVRHDLPPRGVELLEVVDADHDRPQLLGLHRHEGPEVLVPRRQEGEDRDGRDGRPGQGHDDAAVDAEPARPVDLRGLVELLRDGVEVLVEEEDREGVGDERDDLHLVGVEPALAEPVGPEEGQLIRPTTAAAGRASRTGRSSVARMIPSTMPPPLNPIRARANAAIELTTMPSTTVTTVMRTEFIMNCANGTRPKTPV